jgi:hypothetical protein
MQAADFDTLHSIRWICLVALGSLLNKLLQAVRVEVVRLVPRSEVVAEDDRYRTVPVGAWVQASNPSVDLGLAPAAEEALHKTVDISVPAAALIRRETFLRRVAFLHYRLL